MDIRRLGRPQMFIMLRMLHTDSSIPDLDTKVDVFLKGCDLSHKVIQADRICFASFVSPASMLFM